MSVTVKDLFTKAFKVPEKISDCSGKERSVQIVLVRFCCTRFINDSRCLPGERATETQFHMLPRENHVSFVQMSSADRAPELKVCWIIAVTAIRNMDTREEFHINYGSEYSFP